MMDREPDATRFMVLDDESDVTATICMMAVTGGHHAEHMGDADVFLARVAVSQPTHVRVDLQLADRDGVEVIHRLAKIGCKASVIVMSGLGGRILESAGRVATENGLRLIGTLAKPFPRTELLALLAASTRGEASPRVPLPAAAGIPCEQRLEEALHAQAFIAHFQPKFLVQAAS